MHRVTFATSNVNWMTSGESHRAKADYLADKHWGLLALQKATPGLIDVIGGSGIAAVVALPALHRPGRLGATLPKRHRTPAGVAHPRRLGAECAPTQPTTGPSSTWSAGTHATPWAAALRESGRATSPSSTGAVVAGLDEDAESATRGDTFDSNRWYPVRTSTQGVHHRNHLVPSVHAAPLFKHCLTQLKPGELSTDPRDATIIASCPRVPVHVGL